MLTVGKGLRRPISLSHCPLTVRTSSQWLTTSPILLPPCLTTSSSTPIRRNRTTSCPPHNHSSLPHPTPWTPPLVLPTTPWLLCPRPQGLRISSSTTMASPKASRHLSSSTTAPLLHQTRRHTPSRTSRLSFLLPQSLVPPCHRPAWARLCSILTSMNPGIQCPMPSASPPVSSTLAWLSP